MSKACTDKSHRPDWRVTMRNGNRSAFNGYKFTPSQYSELQCQRCGAVWRSNAAYVASVPSSEPLAPGSVRRAVLGR